MVCTMCMGDLTEIYKLISGLEDVEDNQFCEMATAHLMVNVMTIFKQQATKLSCKCISL